MFGVGVSELLLVAIVAATAFLADPLVEYARRLGWIDLDPPRRATEGAAPRVPYRVAEAPPVNPLVVEIARLRRSLIVTRVAAIAASLVLVALGRLRAPASSVALPSLLTERARAVPPLLSPPAPRTGLPFDPVQNPIATIGEHFTYPFGVGGYQVPVRFDLPAQDPTAADEPLVSATLELDVHLRVIPGQLQGTEGIWIDGVLTGTTFSDFRVPSLIREDLSGQNVAFTDAVTRCCREQLGHVSLPLAALLAGSGRTVESVLADRRLDVDIADDVEVYGAGLSVCRRAPSRASAPRCVTVGARSLANGP